MSNSKHFFKKNKIYKINWGGMLIPFIFLFFCVSYIIQVIHVGFISLYLAVFALAIAIPSLIILIFKNIEKVDKENAKISTQIQPNLSNLLVSNIKKFANSNVVRVIFLYFFCLSLFGRLFGFAGFVSSFTMLTFISLGVKNLVFIILIPIILVLLVHYVFVGMLYIPLPKGIFY